MSSQAKQVIELIRSRGYWEIDIRPDEPSEPRFESIPDCMNKVRENRVQLRGWDYPHFSSKDTYPMQGRIESFVDFGFNKEYWAMFLNGHFYHLHACMEDWLREETPIFGIGRYSHMAPGTALDFLNTLYSVTEMYEFAIRLAQKNAFGRRPRIKISLHGMEGRRLTSLSPGRHLFREYVCREDNIRFDVGMSVESLIGLGHEESLKTTIGIFEVFNWLNVSEEMLREEQRRFLERRR